MSLIDRVKKILKEAPERTPDNPSGLDFEGQSKKFVKNERDKKKIMRKLSNPSTNSSANLDSQQPLSTTKKGQGSLFKDPGKDTRKRRKDKGTTRGSRTKKYGTKTPITDFDKAKANKEIIDVTGKSAVRDAKKYSKGEYPKVGGGGLKPDIKKPVKGNTPVKTNVSKINVDKIFSGTGNVKKGGNVPDKNISPKSKGSTPVKTNVSKLNVDKVFDKPKSPIKKTIVVKQSEVSKKAKDFTAKVNKANVKVQKNFVGRKAVRIKDATLGKKTGSLRKGNLSFPGDRSGAYQATKSDIEARKGFRDVKPGGLKADERNPFVKRSVRKGRVDDLGGNIFDQPKYTDKDFKKSFKDVEKAGKKFIGPRQTQTQVDKRLGKVTDPFKGPRQKFASGSLGYKDPGKLLNYEFQPSRKPVSTASLDDAPRIKKRFSKLSQDIKDLKRTSSVKSKVKPKKIITNFAKDQKGELALTPKQIERQRLTKDLRDRVAKRRNVATNMQANINKYAGTDKGTKAVKDLRALNAKTRNMARAAETGKVFAPVKYDAAYAKKSLARLGIGSGSKTDQNTFNRKQRTIDKKYRSSATKNIQKNVGRNLLKGFGKKALRFTGNNALGLGLIGLTAYDMYRSSKSQGQSGTPKIDLGKDTKIVPLRLKDGKSIRSIDPKNRTKTDDELLNPGKTSMSNKVYQQTKPGGRYENEKIYNYFKNNQNYKNRLRKLSQQQGKTVNPYGVDLSVPKK